MSWLICKGHHNAYYYRYDFFKTSIEMALEMENREVANLAIGTRLSNLDGKDFTREIRNMTTTKKVNHEENMKRFGK